MEKHDKRVLLYFNFNVDEFTSSQAFTGITHPSHLFVTAFSMTRTLSIITTALALGLTACADQSSTTTTTTKTAHTDARLGSHVPTSYNAAPGGVTASDSSSTVGERAFPTTTVPQGSGGH